MRPKLRPLFCLPFTGLLLAAIAAPVLARDLNKTDGGETPSGAVTFEASVVADVIGVVAGGLERDVAALYAANFIGELDGDQVGIDGFTLHADVQLIGGDEPSSKLIGEAQVVSNIEAVGAFRPLEVWASYQFGKNDKGLAKFGLIDLNADFDAQEVGSLFMNSSHGIGLDIAQTGENGPSIFPTTTGAALVSWSEETWAVRFGAFNAVAGNPDRPKRTVVALPGEDGLLLISEIDVRPSASILLRLGGWHYSSRFDAILPQPGADQRKDNRGIYSMIEYQKGGLGAWLRAGTANTELNPVGTYVGGGVTHDILDGQVGAAFAHARIGDDAVESFSLPGMEAGRAETVLEFTYARSFPHFTLQPNLQYVINPGWNPALDNALVFGLRISVP